MSSDISFFMNGMFFEYDEEKNRLNIKKHGISFRTAARVFFDYDRIEMYDEKNSQSEDRYRVIGDSSAGIHDSSSTATIGHIIYLTGNRNDILHVVYTDRVKTKRTVIRLISARLATNFER